MTSTSSAAQTKVQTQPSGRPPLPSGTRRRVRRTVSFAEAPKASLAPPPVVVAMPRCKSDNQIAKTRRPAILRSVSLGAIDTSHIEGIRPRQRQEGLGEGDGQEQGEEQEELEGSRRALQQEQQQQQQGIVGPRDAELPDSPQKPVSPTGDDSGHSAEEIALRRFMTVVAWGPGMTVLKHNRRKGRARRVLKFNDQEGCLTWSGILPPYYKTQVSAETLLKASRVGLFVTLKIANQGDVGFRCARLTDAIVLEIGLNGVIRACDLE